MLVTNRLAHHRKLPLLAIPLLALGMGAPAYGAEDATTSAAAPATAPSAQDRSPASPSLTSGAPPPIPPTSASSAAAPVAVKRVVYLPEAEKARLREEIKAEVLAQAKEERWAAPGAFPEWLRRLHLRGDIRARWERDLFGAGNTSDGGAFPDFNAINTGKPFDVAFIDIANERYLNVDQNRSRPRLRARLGVDADVGQGFAAGLHLASGDGSSPVSTNQTLGGSPGDFSKYQVWIDRASIRYEYAPPAVGALAVSVGRLENPFFATELLWDHDLSLDGVALRATFPLPAGVTPFVTAGAFPVYTSIFNFPPEQPAKFRSLDRWLYAVQLGADWKPVHRLNVKLGAALYYFDKIEGRRSGPCDTNLKDHFCDTDESRPAFAQKGNTYMALRRPSDAALVAEATAPVDKPVSRYQFFGLASRFRPIALTARVEYVLAPPLKVAVDGEVVRNVGFSRKQISAVVDGEMLALNNRDHCDASGNCHHFAGGRDGYLARLTVGSPTQGKQWDWSASLAYRRLESDAVVDAFTDSDFGLGGTNLKGYHLEAALAVADGVVASARWLSADAIVGPTYGADVLMFDLSARF